VGRIDADGQVRAVWEAGAPVRADPDLLAYPWAQPWAHPQAHPQAR
jgi:hypothetical protein